jgi:3-oxoacyl-[acyl-carrier protein] reductase
MRQSLLRKVALVTGAGRGLGRAAAERLAAEGCVVMVNDRDREAARNTMQRLAKTAELNHTFSGHDVTTAAKNLVEETVRQHGRLDILVNNAGILRDGLLLKLSEADFDAVVQVNMKSVFSMTQAAANVMKAQFENGGPDATQGGGSIVNIASISYLGNVGQTNYSAAKAGVVAMTRTWALELARYGIRVNAVAPGLMDTEMIQSIPDTLRQRMIESVPLRRIGRPEEFGAAVAFLAGEESSYVTGHVLHLDGGVSVGGF